MHEESAVGRAEIELMVGQAELFEKAYGIYENFRTAIGDAQGRGYAAARAGTPREKLPHQERSHEAYSWLNGWAVGNFDDRWSRGEAKLPPSPGMSGVVRRSLNLYE